MGLFKKRSTDPEEIERLKAEIAAMSSRLNASDDAKQDLEGQVRGIAARLDTPITAPPTEPPPRPPGAVDPADIDRLNAKFDRLAGEIAEVGAAGAAPDDAAFDPAEIEGIRETLGRIDERLDQLDARVTSISTELANQLTELGNELEELDGARPIDEGALADELRDAQTRLASEQARYQIAFREDLAELAARITRT